MLLAIPNWILKEIDNKLDAQIALHPNAANSRDVLKYQLINYANEHGVVPEFSLARTSQERETNRETQNENG